MVLMCARQRRCPRVPPLVSGVWGRWLTERGAAGADPSERCRRLGGRLPARRQRLRPPLRRSAWAWAAATIAEIGSSRAVAIPVSFSQVGLL
jgi:hypothetical protein